MALRADEPRQARRSARSRSGCACAASPTSPSAPCANGSSTSPISVFCRPRISSANFSSDAAGDRERRQQLGVAVALDDLRRRPAPAARPSRAQTRGLDRRVEVRERADRARQLADATRSRARGARRSTVALRAPRTTAPASAPNVIGSACTPCVRPIIGVRRCSLGALADRLRQRRRGPAGSTSQASRICSACAVSMTSDEVRPKCSQRADGPTFSATAVVNAMTSCWVVCSISSMRAMSNAPRSRRCRARPRPARCRRPPSRRRRRARRAARSRTGAGRSRSRPSPDGCSAESCDRQILSRSGVDAAPASTLPEHASPTSAPFANRSRATRCTSSAVTRSMPASVSSSAELPVEVDLLAREVRHAARRVLEAQHQAALQVILRAPQLRVRHRRLLQRRAAPRRTRSTTSPTASFAQPA